MAASRPKLILTAIGIRNCAWKLRSNKRGKSPAMDSSRSELTVITRFLSTLADVIHHAPLFPFRVSQIPDQGFSARVRLTRCITISIKTLKSIGLVKKSSPPSFMAAICLSRSVSVDKNTMEMFV